MAVAKKKPSATTTLHIKNMVCNRCIKVVRDEFQKLGVEVRSIALGEVVVAGTLSRPTLKEITSALTENDFELIENKESKTVEAIKLAILRIIQHTESSPRRALPVSKYLSRELGEDYHSLSSLFSSIEGITIERYLILQRIERVKELIKYRQRTLSEISFLLGYSSVQHLSNQFKKVTGMTPTQFKAMVRNIRRPLDRVT